VLLRLAALAGPIRQLDIPLGRYRSHGANNYYRAAEPQQAVQDRWVHDAVDACLAAANAVEAAAAEGADHLDRVGEAIGRMDARLDELRTLAEHGQSVTVTEPVAFGAAVRAVWREGDTDGPSLSVAADGTIEAERGRLDSILEQLLRHSAERGAARVEVALTETGFTFEDDGSEIPEPDLEAVFESGTTTASDSAGLGLEIVRAQVESQGWQVCVERTATGVAFVVTGGTTTVETEGSR
jgi:signal transduction histidine kinase